MIHLPWYKCLKCGHKLFKEHEVEGPLQCTNYHCRSYWMVEEEMYESIVSSLVAKVDDSTPFVDMLLALSEILSTQGITGQPLKTLAMARHLVEEAERRKRQTPQT